MEQLEPFPGGWEVHRHRHCIWIVSPEGFQHQHAFDEFAEALEEAFSELGGSAPITRDPREWDGRIPIVLGPNLLRGMGPVSLPAGSIMVNLEQILPGNKWLHRDYLSLLRRFPVLDYNPRNRERLRHVGVSHAGLLEVGYSPVLTRIPTDVEKDIDVLFYGSVLGCERRERILDALPARGLKVVELFGAYGAERDAAIARAKVVLNLHHDDTSPFEIIRVSYLLANRVCVVSEGDADDPDIEWLAGGLALAPYDELIDRCLDLANDAARREEIARTGFERISTRRQSYLLQQCLVGT